MSSASFVANPSSAALLGEAVHRQSVLSVTGALERTFSFAFRSLVYPQIWEDPRVDMEALDLQSHSRMVTISSGGCNVMSYLTANPARIYAVDLNTSHIALLKLKLAAARHLPTHATFHRFFAGASDFRNARLYDDLIAPHLDRDARAYWESRSLTGRRMISRFGRNFYRYGLLGRFIATGHVLARALGADPSRIAQARTVTEQQEIFEREIAPLFEKPVVRWLTSHRASLFGLGIPPAQYDALSEHGARDMSDVLLERTRKLATGFALSDNYFAWQAFARRYDPDRDGAVPPYLAKANFMAIKTRVDRVVPLQQNMIHFLAGEPAESLDRYSLLDAQDWMDDETLTSLWREIDRTARPGSRVIFRTAGRDSILPGRVPQAILDRWSYQSERSAELEARDRSAIYGGFHLYIKAG